MNGLMRIGTKQHENKFSKRYFECVCLFTRQIHSQITKVNHRGFSVTVIPFAKDNYSYLVVDEKTKQSAIVDPGSPLVDVYLHSAKKESSSISLVLNTHHHR